MTPPQDGRAWPAAGVAVPTDRRYRRPDHKPDRRRMGRRIARGAVWMALGLGLATCAGWAFDWLLRTEALSVRDVAVHGNARLSTGEVELLVQGLRGENILQVDFETYRRRMLDSPWVADVTFRRALPSTIDIRVVERTPLAIARLGQPLYLIDEGGVIIDEYSAIYADLDLPIVDGLLAPAPADGPLIDAERTALLRALLSALGARPELTRRLSQVRVTSGRDVVVMFDAYPVWLHLGHARFVERLQTFFEIAPTLEARFADIDSVDLRFDDRVFVRPAAGGLRPGRRSDSTSRDTVQRPSPGRVGEEAHGA